MMLLKTHGEKFRILIDPIMFMKTNELINLTHDVDENKGESSLAKFGRPRRFSQVRWTLSRLSQTGTSNL